MVAAAAATNNKMSLIVLGSVQFGNGPLPTTKLCWWQNNSLSHTVTVSGISTISEQNN